MDKINDLIANEQFEEAKAELLKIIKNDEKDFETLKLLGLCQVNLGEFEDGRKTFETVIKYKQDDATSWFYLANCYDNLNDFISAKNAYLEVIKLRETYLDAYKNLAVL